MDDPKSEHKFKGTWHSRLYHVATHTLIEDGKMHLKKMKETGEVEEGEHEDPQGRKHPITNGKATDERFLTITVGGHVYEGEIINNPGPTLIIVGRQRNSVELGAAFSQDDPPWVITKP